MCVELMFGIWAAECVFVPLNFKLHPREMADILADCGAATVFASPKLAGGLAGAGVVGRSIAHDLQDSGHQVVLIDKRRSVLRLSAAGWRIHDVVAPRARQHEREFLATLSGEERDWLARILDKLMPTAS